MIASRAPSIALPHTIKSSSRPTSLEPYTSQTPRPSFSLSLSSPPPKEAERGTPTSINGAQLLAYPAPLSPDTAPTPRTANLSADVMFAESPTTADKKNNEAPHLSPSSPHRQSMSPGTEGELVATCNQGLRGFVMDNTLSAQFYACVYRKRPR